MIKEDSEILINYWLEYFSDEEKDEEYRYYDDFLGFFEECVQEDLNPTSDSAQAMKYFLEKLSELIGYEKFFNFNRSVYTCFLKFPVLKRMEELGLINYENVAVMTKFFEALTSRIIMEVLEHQQKIQEQSAEELAQREAPIAEIWERIFMVSIVGTLDSDRVLKIIDKVLENIELKNTQYVIIDISAIFDMNSEVANQLIKLNNAVHFMGATPVLTGITKNIAKSLTHLNINLGDVKTYSTTKLALEKILKEQLLYDR